MKHSLANYPKKFLGCVVSPTKICLQFEGVQSKLRFKQGAHYVKLHDTTKALPISISGTDVDIVAVGCQMPVIEELQGYLIQAYRNYASLYSAVYREQYGKDFLAFLLTSIKELEDVIIEVQSTRGDADVKES